MHSFQGIDGEKVRSSPNEALRLVYVQGVIEPRKVLKYSTEMSALGGRLTYSTVPTTISMIIAFLSLISTPQSLPIFFKALAAKRQLIPIEIKK
jgi:hypothetical protein